MILRLRYKKIVEPQVVFSPKVVLLQPNQVVSEGIISRISSFQVFDIAGSLKPFKASAFSISSLRSVGALDKLKTTYMSSMHDMNVADSFENIIISTDVQ